MSINPHSSRSSRTSQSSSVNFIVSFKTNKTIRVAETRSLKQKLEKLLEIEKLAKFEINKLTTATSTIMSTDGSETENMQQLIVSEENQMQVAPYASGGPGYYLETQTPNIEANTEGFENGQARNYQQEVYVNSNYNYNPTVYGMQNEYAARSQSINQQTLIEQIDTQNQFYYDGYGQNSYYQTQQYPTYPNYQQYTRQYNGYPNMPTAYGIPLYQHNMLQYQVPQQAQRLPYPMPQRIPQTTQPMLQRAPERIPKRTQERMPQHTQERMPQRTQERMPQRTQERMPQRTQERMPQRMLEYMPAQTPQRILQSAPQRIPQSAPQRMPVPAPQRMPEPVPQRILQRQQFDMGKEPYSRYRGPYHPENNKQI